MVATVQTFGELAHWHPHVHAIVTDGVFSKDGTFIPLPEMAVEPFLKLWEKKVFDLLLKRGKITPEIVKQMRSWQHSGFSVHKKVWIAENDPDGLEKLIQYIARCPFSLSRIIRVTEAGQVIYKTEHDGCRRFPDPASDNLKSGISRELPFPSVTPAIPLRYRRAVSQARRQIFDPLDFLAEVTAFAVQTGPLHTRVALPARRRQGCAGGPREVEDVHCQRRQSPDLPEKTG
jgi:hypothetical protein